MDLIRANGAYHLNGHAVPAITGLKRMPTIKIVSEVSLVTVNSRTFIPKSANGPHCIQEGDTDKVSSALLCLK